MCQQEKAKHHPKSSSIHHTWKKDLKSNAGSLFWCSTASERWPDCGVLHTRAGGTELSEEILSEREQMFYRCLTEVCVAFESLRRDGWGAAFCI